MAAKLGIVHVAYVLGGCTAWCKPLDVAYMRDFKNHQAGESANHFAADILTNTDVRVISRPRPGAEPPDAEWEETVQHARQLSMEGSLWDRAGFWEDEPADECPSDVEEVPDETAEKEADPD
eukprot:3919018-Amphidinium_carterae.2